MQKNYAKNPVLTAALLVFAVSFSPFQASAAATGGLPGYFMAQGLGARALGMGGAYTGVADDASSVYWNPAGLAQLRRWELQGMYANLYEETKFQSAAFAGKVPFTTDFMFGLGYMQLSSVDFIRRDSNNNPIGNFSDMKQSLIFSFAKPLPYGVSLGLSGRLNTTAIDDYSQSAGDVDAGIMWRPVSFFTSASRFLVSAGAVARNLSGAEVKRTDIVEVAPKIISLGGALGYSFGPSMSAIIAADMDKIAGQTGKIRLGVEIGFLKDAGFLRGGMDGSDWSIGGGFRFGSFSMDYAMLNRSELGGNHNVSLSYKFGAIQVLQNKCLTPECRAEYDKVEDKLDSCESKVLTAGGNIRDCDKAMEEMEAYVRKHAQESASFDPLRERHNKLSASALENVLVVCKIVSKDVQLDAEWDTDLFDAFNTYLSRNHKNMRIIGKFDCNDQARLDEVKERNEKFIIVGAIILSKAGKSTVRIKIANESGESIKKDVEINETLKGIDFRTYADKIVKEFKRSGIEK